LCIQKYLLLILAPNKNDGIFKGVSFRIVVIDFSRHSTPIGTSIVTHIDASNMAEWRILYYNSKTVMSSFVNKYLRRVSAFLSLIMLSFYASYN